MNNSGNMNTGMNRSQNFKVLEEKVEGKVFIGGLNKSSTKDQLVSYCQSWGPLKDAVVMEQKGFGFVTYQDPRHGMKFLEDGPHTIDGKLVEAKAAVPKGQGGNQNMVKKMFVGGIVKEVTNEEFKTHWSQFGEFSDADESQIVRQPDGTSKGFGFVTFKNEISVEKCLLVYHELGGKRVDIRRAVPRDQLKVGGQGNMQGGMQNNNMQGGMNNNRNNRNMQGFQNGGGPMRGQGGGYGNMGGMDGMGMGGGMGGMGGYGMGGGMGGYGMGANMNPYGMGGGGYGMGGGMGYGMGQGMGSMGMGSGMSGGMGSMGSMGGGMGGMGGMGQGGGGGYGYGYNRGSDGGMGGMNRNRFKPY